MILEFQKKRKEIALFLNQVLEFSKCKEKSLLGKELILSADESLKIFVDMYTLLKQMNKEEIEHVSCGMKDRGIVLRLFEYVMSLGLNICQQCNLISYKEKQTTTLNKNLESDLIENHILSNEDDNFLINSHEILSKIAYIFEDILKNETFINTFNIKEKCVSYTLNIYGELGFGFSNEDKSWSKKFYDLLESLPLNFLLPILIGLNNPKSSKWMRCIVCKELSKITTRKGGIIAIVEFMKKLPDDNNITINNLDKAVSLITSIPKDISKETYIKIITSELLSMLDCSSEKSYLFQTSGRIISVLLLSYPEIVYNYIILKIIDPLYSPKQNQNEESIDISLRRIERIIVQSDSNIILSIVSPIFVILWAASCFSHKTHKYIWRDRINSILLSYIIVSDQLTSVFKIIENFLCTGNTYFSFANGEYGGISIEINDLNTILSIEDLDSRIENFGFLIEKLRNDYKLIEDIFLRLLNYWLNKNLKQNQDPIIELSYLKILMLIQKDYLPEIKKNMEKIFHILVDIIRNFNENYKLMQNEKNSVDVNSPSLNNLDKIARNNMDSYITEEDINVVIISLNILNVILVNNSKFSKKEISLLDAIYNQLVYMMENSVEPLRNCAKDLNILVKSCLSLPIISDRNLQTENSVEKYNKAIRYTYDQLIPVRAQGISLLKEMIEARDPIVDINEIMNILIGLLKDDDSFVYLNSIDCLSCLANRNGNYITKYLLNEYANVSKYTLDERIRIGDVLFRIIQYLGKTISSTVSDSIATTMLDISTCSTNDIRLRSSALNLLGTACNCSFYGMGQWCFRALESSLGILNFEKTEEHIIVRRAAIMVIANILQATDEISSIPGHLLRTILKTIRYIKVTDQDIIMRRQASGLLDAMEEKLEKEMGIYPQDTILNILI
ncbi:hypothetical protein PORY_001386 [Pneumocystis oryctolagi]|uniref:Uncharacterized protein n=1 Tax=Pneumocystis oryctolagi TaxID=42067 RepID=A0ACB7CCE4_9ASCO|nr:hypothetical protein PORY_001386 [Pneumocystis oryctolagi]